MSIIESAWAFLFYFFIGGFHSFGKFLFFFVCLGIRIPRFDIEYEFDS